jgi:hypothetical protein
MIMGPKSSILTKIRDLVVPVLTAAGFLLVFLSHSSQAFGWEIAGGSFDAWLERIQMNPKTKSQMQVYFKQGDSDSMATYSSQVMKIYKKRLESATRANILEENVKCSPKVSTTFNPQLTNMTGEIFRDFEEELIQIETVDCLQVSDLSRVVKTFLDDRFQEKYVNGLETSQTVENKNRVCQKTKTFIGVSDFCVEFSLWRDESTVVLISQNIESSETNSAPVYLRLVATVFIKMNDGVMFYNLTFGRGPDLPLHLIVKQMVGTQHKTYIDGLVSESNK